MIQSFQHLFLYSIQATAGFLADGRHISNVARDELADYREIYRSPAPLKVGKS